MNYFGLFALLLLLPVSAFSQSKLINTMERQARKLGSEKNITVTHDTNSNSSKVMLVADNFDEGDVSRANLMAMNFASGFFFVGDTLAAAPERMQFTFWVMSKKPRFAAAHELEFIAGSESILVGAARYAAKPGRNMEYLNYEISRTDIGKIAKQTRVIAKIGAYEFQLTRRQLKSLADLLLITDTAYCEQ